VLILHGLLDQGAAWSQVAEPLADAGYRVHAPDQRGHGQSVHAPTGAAYPFSDYVVDAAALCRELGLDRLHLVGHSMGATVAALLAGADPSRVATLSLIEGLGPPSTPPERAVTQLREHLRDRLDRVPSHRPLDSPSHAAERMRRFNPGLSPSQAQDLAQRVTQPAPTGCTWTWDAAHKGRSAAPFDLERFLCFLQEIQAPTQVIVGARSWYGQVDQLDRRQAALRDGTRTTLQTGHNPHIEAPAALATALLDHLKLCAL
jgi:pimeloyl-ACP methyl ester carboxylesterase